MSDLERSKELDQMLKYSDDSGDVEEAVFGSPTAGKPSNRCFSLKVTLLLHWAVIGILCLVISDLYPQVSKTKVEIAERVYSPAQDLVQSQNVVFTSGFGTSRTEYMGEPTPENDAAWSDLYNFGISRIPRSSAAQLVNKTVPIPDDAGHYAVSLNVFHQLHCLNTIRKRLYSNETFDRKHELMGLDHLEHCVDALRQSLMCASDITPLPWTWVEADQEAKEVAEVVHTCRNFENIREWAKENSAKHFDRHTYVHDDLLD